MLLQPSQCGYRHLPVRRHRLAPTAPRALPGHIAAAADHPLPMPTIRGLDPAKAERVVAAAAVAPARGLLVGRGSAGEGARAKAGWMGTPWHSRSGSWLKRGREDAPAEAGDGDADAEEAEDGDWDWDWGDGRPRSSAAAAVTCTWMGATRRERPGAAPPPPCSVPRC